MRRRLLIWPLAAIGLGASFAKADGPPPVEAHPPSHAQIHPHHPTLGHLHHGSEGRDPLLRFYQHKPDSNAARQRRGEGPVRKRPLAPNDFHNTGHPNELGHWAAPTVSHRYWGYYVGGGAAGHGGEPRCVQDGTWGWDYTGGLIHRKVALLWTHGRKYQDGNGRYTNNYPYEYRNPFFYVESLGVFLGGEGEGEGGGEGGAHGAASHAPGHGRAQGPRDH